MTRRILLAAALLVGAVGSWAGELTVSDAWVRATAPGQDSAAVSLRVTAERDARIVGVSSTVAASAAIHVMKHENGMMVMRETAALPLPAKQEVTLGHGDHVMLMGLKQQLKAGDSVPLKLVVEFADKQRETVEVKAEVRPIAAGHDMHDMGDMHHHDHH